MIRLFHRYFCSALVLFSPLWATPRYALESSTSCNLCHVKPGGGGLRNDYGILFGLDDLTKIVPEKFKSYSGIILNHIRFGGDVRIQSISREEGEVPRDLAVFPMQANLQLVYQKEGFAVQSELALLRSDIGVQLNYYIKDNYIQAGKGKPVFGLQLADHTVFTRGGNMRLRNGENREGMPFSPLLKHVPFIAVGRYFGDGHFTAGFSQGYFSSVSRSFYARGEHFGSLGQLSRMMGVSYLTDTKNKNGLSMINIFGGLSGRKLSLLGEVTVAENLVEGRSYASYSELTWGMKKGFSLSGRIDFFDESILYTKDAIRRTTFGLNYVPFPFVDIKFQIRSTQLSIEKASKGLEFLTQLHIWF